MANELDKLHAPGQHAKWRSLAETVELRRKCIEEHKWPGCEEDPNFTNDGEGLSSMCVWCLTVSWSRVYPAGPDTKHVLVPLDVSAGQHTFNAVCFWDDDQDCCLIQNRREAAERALGFRLNKNALWSIEGFDPHLQVSTAQ
jgi:hypothetical protein